MAKLAIISANLGGFDPITEHEEQELPNGIEAIKYHRFTDSDFPPRFNAMTPRLQARLVKMFMWEFEPGYDFYLWVDSSCKLSRSDSAKWFMENLGEADIAVFKHNRRQTVQEEADYLKKRLELEKAGVKQPYVLPRYKNELIDEQLEVVDPKAELYASTALIYCLKPSIMNAMKEWSYHTVRYHLIDQLSLPYAIQDLKVNVIKEDYLKCRYIQHVRKTPNTSN